MASRQVLVIRNLPSDLSDANKEDLLRHFGAISVKIVTSKRKPIVFAKFETEAKARNVLFRLHQLEVLGNRLVAEYAKETVNLADPRIDKISTDKSTDHGKEYFKEFINKLNSWNSSVDFHQPPPPHLKYIYPRANVATVNNIAHALASVPKFYTQVLHLMNKMNLPPPFSNIPDPPELQIQQMSQPSESQSNEPQIEPQPKTSSESELESDPEEYKLDENIPVKRKLSQQKKHVKRPKFIKPQPTVVNPQKSSQINTEDLFDKVELEPSQRKIEMKVSADCVENIKQNKSDMIEDSEQSSFIKINRVKLAEVKEDLDAINSSIKAAEKTGVISEKELNANKISEKDFDHLPVFKNYHAGAPSCRLYIKNLSKNITVDDLNYIYKRYLDDNEEHSNMFDIRLMQEGRMKGQAFVTLPTVALAKQAVQETNGYILKDKPICVVFARSAKTK
ncbi:RNA-binding region-containing protein 3-like [Chrysoperla carnea]|uniref:RNA-binding region-containing protein 3-like n=1 Tax=Chrysoperla carnea TaxID=189513 RepID=UPI001D0913C5|nr:RNA-binding region-containing protein 3-like [Chrysoperla carnea]